MSVSRSPLVVRGVIRAPGDKSISHRALIFAAMASGPTRIRDILASADVQATAGALRALGADIPALSDDFVVHGRGVASLHSPESALDCGNSGTTTRLIAGLVAGLPGRVARFEGAASLSRRPMRRIAAPLSDMGARIGFEGAGGHDGLPMRVHGMPLSALTVVNTHASAQVKGALILAGLASGAGVTVQEPQRSRDGRERDVVSDVDRGFRCIASYGRPHRHCRRAHHWRRNDRYARRRSRVAAGHSNRWRGDSALY